MIATLAGTGAGAVVGHFQGKTTFTREQESKRRELVRGKLEEAHQAIEDVRLFFLDFAASAVDFVNTGEAKPNRVLNFPRPKMLIDIYAPELSGLMKRLEGEWIKQNQAWVRMLVARDQVTLDEVMQATASIGHLCSDIQDALAQESRKY